MFEARDNMVKALKAVVCPVLRQLSFRGSFPHLRRRRDQHLELVTFQFDRYGGGFVIELGRCGERGFTTQWGEWIPPDKVRAWDVDGKQRTRIHRCDGAGADSWFRYGFARSPDDFRLIAESLLPFVDTIENTFNDFDHVPKIGEDA